MEYEYTNTITTNGSFSKEQTKTFDELIEVLFINMYGESQREGAIYINDIDAAGIYSKILLKIGLKVATLFDTKIKIRCSLKDYFIIKVKYKDLFKKKRYIYWTRDKNHRSAKTWLEDISNARGLDSFVWFDVEEYMNNECSY